MSGFKSLTKRKRELAKLDKRQAKDQRRALRRAARSETGDVASVPPSAATTNAIVSDRLRPPVVPASKPPLTLAEAVERWRNTKVVKPKRR